MNNKRFKMFLGIVIIIALLVCTGVYIYGKLAIPSTDFLEEYTPEEEISNEQIRRTIVKLYFKEINSNELKFENRSIDSKNLLGNPYDFLINLLINGPSNDELEKTIPDGTILNSTSLVNDILFVDLSEDFINSNVDANLASTIVYSIVNTLTQFNEINSIKFTINGNDKASFKNCEFSLKNPFVVK